MMTSWALLLDASFALSRRRLFGYRFSDGPNRALMASMSKCRKTHPDVWLNVDLPSVLHLKLVASALTYCNKTLIPSQIRGVPRDPKPNFLRRSFMNSACTGGSPARARASIQVLRKTAADGSAKKWLWTM
jgi:hypothetical protein